MDLWSLGLAVFTGGFCGPRGVVVQENFLPFPSRKGSGAKPRLRIVEHDVGQDLGGG